MSLGKKAKQRRRRGSLTFWLVLVLFVVMAIVPLLNLFVGSFFPEGSFSLEAWRKILATHTERMQLLHSGILGGLATLFAVLLGGGTAWLTERTDLPFARVLGPMALLPLLFPPIVVAMSFADLSTATGLPVVALLLGVSHAPFAAALTARGLRSIDGRLYESTLLARGRLRAELFLLRQCLADILAGALLVLVFVLSNHGVPEFFSVKKKAWFVYSEAVFLRWSAPGKPGSLRAAEAIASSAPLLLLIGLALLVCLRARRKGTLVTVASDFRPLPLRRLGRGKFPALGFALILPLLGIVMPLWRMLLWSAGSTANFGISTQTAVESFRRVVTELSGDLGYTLGMAALAGLVVVLVALPLAFEAARRRPWIEALSLIPLAVPGILLGVALVRLWNDPHLPLAQLYDTPALLVSGYATRFLPLGVLALANAARRLPQSFDEAARLCGRGPLMRWLKVQGPLLLPTAVSVFILGYILSLRELDLAVILPPGNDMVSRRLANIVHFGNEDVGGAIAVLLALGAALPILMRILLTGRAGRADL